MEVMIAITIFAFFSIIFIINKANNVSDSFLLEEEIFLKQLCENVINELVIDPPEFKDSLELIPKTTTFDDHKEYEYTIEYKKFKVPDISKIQGNDENSDGNNSSIQSSLIKKISDSMGKMIWQARITVRNKETKFSYTLSTWLFNYKAKLDFNSI